MKPNVILLIEYLMCLTEDEFPAVRDKANEALNTIITNFIQGNNMKFLVELLEENFYDMLTKLPRIIRKSGTIISQLLQYLEII